MSEIAMGEIAKKIKKLYDMGVYPKSWVVDDMRKGAITSKEYAAIVEDKDVG